MGTGASGAGWWTRWRVVAAVWLGQATLMMSLPGVVLQLGEERINWRYLSEGDYWLYMLGVVGVLTVVQAVFLWPVRKPAPRLGRGISMWLTAGVAGLAAAALAAGAVMTVADAAWLMGGPLVEKHWPWLGWAALGVGWLVFTPLMGAFVRRGRRETVLGRLSARLFLGTIVEVVALIPVDVMVRKKTDCYCAMGTFWALVACGSIGFLSLGPAIFLPILSRRRKRWYDGHCDACGYDMSGTPVAERCPECGAGWKPTGLAAP